jgi:sulfofructose kinase
MTAKVFCLGVATLDLIYAIERLPADDGKISAASYHLSGGGMAANAAVAIARLGGGSSWCGRLGDDEHGRRILEGLAAESVDGSQARVFPGVASPHSVVLVDNEGRRALVLFRPALDDSDAGWLPLDAILSSDALLADNRWVAGAKLALAAARARGLPAVLDADVGTGAETREAVRAATHTIFAGAALASLYETDDVEAGLRRASADCSFVAVTLGAQGVCWIDQRGAFHSLPAFPVVALETVGAGDVFHGAFALALLETGEEGAALRFAAAAAALKCAGRGGRSSFPSRAEVEKLLAGRAD